MLLIADTSPYPSTHGATSSQAAAVTRDTGRFSFFTPGNVELVVKVVDGCGTNDRFWVFAGGLTNVRASFTVTDTTTGFAKIYQNPAGRPFAPVQDTGAFGCPTPAQARP